MWGTHGEGGQRPINGASGGRTPQWGQGQSIWSGGQGIRPHEAQNLSAFGCPNGSNKFAAFSQFCKPTSGEPLSSKCEQPLHPRKLIGHQSWELPSATAMSIVHKLAPTGVWLASVKANFKFRVSPSLTRFGNVFRYLFIYYIKSGGDAPGHNVVAGETW